MEFLIYTVKFSAVDKSGFLKKGGEGEMDYLD